MNVSGEILFTSRILNHKVCVHSLQFYAVFHTSFFSISFLCFFSLSWFINLNKTIHEIPTKPGGVFFADIFFLFFFFLFFSALSPVQVYNMKNAVWPLPQVLKFMVVIDWS